MPPLAQKTSAFATGAAVAALARFVAVVACGRLLGPEGAGKVALLVWAAEMVSLLVGIGMPAAMTRAIPTIGGDSGDSQVRQLVAWFSRSHLVQFIVGVLVVSALASTYFQSETLSTRFALVAAFGTSFLGAGTLCVVNGLQDYRHLAKLWTATGATQVVMVSAGAWLWGISGALAGYALGNLLPATLFLRGLATSVRGGIDPNLQRDIRKYAWAQWLSVIAVTVVWSRSELLFLEGMLDSKALGFYAVGLSLVSAATQIPVVLSGAVLGHVSELVGRGDFDEAQRVFDQSVVRMAALLIPACLGLAVVSHQLTPTVFGNQFSEAAAVTAVLALGGIAQLGYIPSAFVYALGKPGYQAWNGWISSALLIVLLPFGIAYWGIVGAACVRSVIQVVAVVATLDYLRRYHAVRLKARILLKIGATSAAMVLVVLASENWVRSGYLGLVVSLSVGVIFVYLGYLGLGVLSEMGKTWKGQNIVLNPSSVANGSK